jgi:hypothetical protein
MEQAMARELPPSLTEPGLATDLVRLVDAIGNRYTALQLDDEMGPLIRAAWNRYDELKGKGIDFTQCDLASRVEAVQALCRARGLVLPRWPRS